MFQYFDRNNTTIIDKLNLCRIFRLLNEVFIEALTHSLTNSLLPTHLLTLTQFFSHAFTSVIRTFRCNSLMTSPIPYIPTAAKSMVTYAGKTILHSLGITQYCKCSLIIYTFSHYYSLLLTYSIGMYHLCFKDQVRTNTC